MALTLDFSADPGLIWDNPEAVTYTTPDGTQSVALTVAIKQQLTLREVAQSGGFYASQDAHWFLAGVQFVGPVQPAVGGVITRDADGSEWTLLDLAYEDLDQVYDCTARNFAVVERLTSTIRILTPIARQDDALGRVVIDMVPKQSGIPARIQELSATTSDERGRRIQVREFTVYCGRRVTSVTHEDLVEDEATGQRYEFVSAQDPDAIDKLMTLTVRKMSDDEE